MIDYARLLAQLEGSNLAPLAQHLPAAIASGLSVERYGDLPTWYKAMAELPELVADWVDLRNGVSLGCHQLDSDKRGQLDKALRALIPWRKGPYEVFGIH